MFSLVSAVISGAYALFLAVLGAVYSSAWYGLFGGYYIVLTAMRALVIFGAHRIGKKYAKGQAARARTKLYFGSSTQSKNVPTHTSSMESNVMVHALENISNEMLR